MPTSVPVWGNKPCPLLPESLRGIWQADPIPKWVCAELALLPGATFAALGTEAWARTSHNELPSPVKAFLLNTVSLRRFSISNIRVFSSPWPRSLQLDQISWASRTRNCLRRSGLLSDASRLSSLTFSDLFSIQGMGAASILDFSCVAEAVLHPMYQSVALGENSKADGASRLFESIGATWAPQVSSQDPRFSDLLPPGGQTLLEMLETLTAEPEDPPLIEAQLASSIGNLENRLISLGQAPLEVALSDFIDQVSRVRGRQRQALFRRLGCDGSPPATLEEAASILSVTRERMRQIQKRFSVRLPKHPIFMPQLDLAIAAIRDCAPISADRAADLLPNKGITNRPFHPKSVLSAADLCGRLQPFELDNSTGVLRVVVEQKRELEREILIIACRQAEASGAANIQEVGAELFARSKTGASDEVIRRLLTDCSEIEFLSGDWFWHESEIPDRNRLRNLTRKMLSVTCPISVNELREGVHRHYKIRGTRGTSSWPLVTPPRAVLQEFYKRHPEFSIDANGLVASVDKLEYGSELNPTERILLEVLRSSPACLLDRSSLARNSAEMGMNPNTFSPYLSSSPVIAHIGIDMWSLRGIKVDPAAVEALRSANAASPLEKRIIDHGWTETGELWLAARLPECPTGFVLNIPSAIRRYVVGRNFPATDEQALAVGTVRVNSDGVSYGYGPFLARRGADVDDFLLVSFRLAAGVASLRLIDDEELESLSPGM
jgi:hypothetical protein